MQSQLQLCIHVHLESSAAINRISFSHIYTLLQSCAESVAAPHVCLESSAAINKVSCSYIYTLLQSCVESVAGIYRVSCCGVLVAEKTGGLEKNWRISHLEGLLVHDLLPHPATTSLDSVAAVYTLCCSGFRVYEESGFRVYD